jgi:spore coat polysaccharide biosynthesis protein SpsF
MSGVVTIIQARTRSTRLPGKVLLPLGGRPALEVMLERVLTARLTGTVVVATTIDAADEPIVALSHRLGVPCWRGHPTDLLDRHHGAAMAFQADHVVKIPSDCPLIDPQVIDHVLSWYLARTDSLDYASNLHPATHPDGNDVEVIRMDALATAWREATRSFEREHTTPFLWNQPHRYRLGNVAWNAGRDCSRSHRVVLDYPEDYQLIREVYDALGTSDPLFNVYHLVSFLDAHPAVAALNTQHRGAHWYLDHLDELPGLTHLTVAPAEAR